MDTPKKSILKYILPPIIILFGFLILIGLTKSKSKPKRIHQSFPGVLVQVVEAVAQQRNVTVRGYGTVRPHREISMAFQVAGRVEWVAPDFVIGGRFQKGVVLARIEQDDYILAVDQARAAVANAEFGLAVAKANAEVARKEWINMQSTRQRLSSRPADDPRTPAALVLHEPQLKQAEANLASANAALGLAELHLQRTEITAPFNCRIKRESMDPGQYVNPGVSIATLYSTDMVELDVGIPISELPWVKVPGAEAIVKLNINSKTFTWNGIIDRNLGIIDERDRLARLVVQVTKPFAGRTEYSPELNIGTFVEIEIEGRLIERTIPLPRHALREGSTVWIAAPDSTLDIRSVLVERLTPEEVLISEGINTGEQIILSSISSAAPGLKLRPVAVRKAE